MKNSQTPTHAEKKVKLASIFNLIFNAYNAIMKKGYLCYLTLQT